VLGELGVGALHARLVAARPGHAALELVGHPHGGSALEEVQRPDVALNPVHGLLRPGSLGVGVVGRAEHRDKQLHLHRLARRVDDRGAGAGVVGEHLLARAMDVAHRRRLASAPALVDLAKLRVPVAVGGLFQVLDVEQLERHALLAQLQVQRRRVG
jgi:hypothetical protein